MREEILHYIWENRLFENVTLDDEPLEVLSVGQRNIGDGPDFSLAVIRHGEMTWIGAVEMHVRSSDWFRHRHQEDPKYDNIILHLVLEKDCEEVTNSRKEQIPTALLTVKSRVLGRIEELEISSKALRCTPELSYISPHTLRRLTAPLIRERIDSKTKRSQTPTGDLRELFYRLLLRYLGAHQNNQVMEDVASSTPLSALRKHASDTEVIESILLGQAALFAENPRDEYENELREKYEFYKRKFDLQPIPSGLFKKLRVRPPAYPTRVLAIAAQVIHREEELSHLMANGDFETIKELLSVQPSYYWQHHIDFAQSYPKPLGGISGSTVRTLLINAVLPVAYLYNHTAGKTEIAEKVLSYYDELPPEKNHIIALFGRNGFSAHTAADSQRMLELYTHFCEPFRCLECPLAPSIVEATTKIASEETPKRGFLCPPTTK